MYGGQVGEITVHAANVTSFILSWPLVWIKLFYALIVLFQMEMQKWRKMYFNQTNLWWKFRLPRWIWWRQGHMWRVEVFIWDEKMFWWTHLHLWLTDLWWNPWTLSWWHRWGQLCRMGMYFRVYKMLRWDSVYCRWVCPSGNIYIVACHLARPEASNLLGCKEYRLYFC